MAHLQRFGESEASAVCCFGRLDEPQNEPLSRFVVHIRGARNEGNLRLVLHSSRKRAGVPVDGHLQIQAREVTEVAVRVRVFCSEHWQASPFISENDYASQIRTIFPVCRMPHD